MYCHNYNNKMRGLNSIKNHTVTTSRPRTKETVLTKEINHSVSVKEWSSIPRRVVTGTLQTRTQSLGKQLSTKLEKI